MSTGKTICLLAADERIKSPFLQYIQRSDQFTTIYSLSADESGSDSDGAESTSSSYSSLSDFVNDIVNSDINGETPGERAPSSKSTLRRLLSQ